MGAERVEQGPSPISHFNRIVLSWDYYELRSLYSKEKGKRSKEEAEALGLRKVKDTYEDVDDYLSTFEPLLFEEVKAQIVRGGDEEKPVSHNAIIVACSESDAYHLVTLGVRPEVTDELGDNDLVLLSNEKFEVDKPLHAYAFALVEYRDGTEKLKLRTFLAGEIKQIYPEKVEPCPRFLRMQSILKATESFLWILKVLIISAAARSFDRANHEDYSLNIPGPLMEYLESNHNASQLEAVRAGLSCRAFVLTQEESSCLKRRPELPIHDKYLHWGKASPWLTVSNPRDLIMPEDCDDGFYPTTGNELVERATLVPLAQAASKCILYGISLFKRFQRAGYPVQMLKSQYRMHPQIRSFPSKEFYSDSLEDGPDLEHIVKRIWHDYCCFGPFCFFDIDGVESQPGGSGSWVNEAEIDFVLLLYHRLVTKYPELKSTS